MRDIRKVHTKRIRIRYYAAILVFLWSIVVSASLTWSAYRGKRGVLSMAHIQARIAHQRDVVYGRWNAELGGVYASIPAETTLNPDPLRVPGDAADLSGLHLTLINPMHMARRIHELAEEVNGIRGRITGLEPIRPENAPDPWETEALGALEAGMKEVVSVEDMGGESYLRVMLPMVTEESCLKCHASEGHETGEIMGGASISVPMAPLRAIERARMLALSQGHGLIWLIGIAGIALGALRLGRQIDERKRAEEALSESEARYRLLSENLEETVEAKMAELRQARDLAAIGQTVSIVAHEIRNPLQNIRLGVDMLLDKIGDDKSNLEHISYGVDSLSGLVEELLEYSKPAKLEYSYCPLRDIVSNTLDSIAGRLDGVRVELELEGQDKEIHVDVDKISRVLLNLMINAIEAMPSGGELLIRSEFHETEGDLILSISDNGCGIDEKHLESINEPFFTTKARGTGLGIPICRKIIDAHNGSLSIRSKVDEGTTVEIRLPA